MISHSSLSNINLILFPIKYILFNSSYLYAKSLSFLNSSDGSINMCLSSIGCSLLSCQPINFLFTLLIANFNKIYSYIFNITELNKK